MAEKFPTGDVEEGERPPHPWIEEYDGKVRLRAEHGGDKEEIWFVTDERWGSKEVKVLADMDGSVQIQVNKYDQYGEIEHGPEVGAFFDLTADQVDYLIKKLPELKAEAQKTHSGKEFDPNAYSEKLPTWEEWVRAASKPNK